MQQDLKRNTLDLPEVHKESKEDNVSIEP